MIAALLHDAAEDHGGERQLREIRWRFGAEVEMIVRALSDSLLDEGQVKQAWRPRKERYLAGLRQEHRAAVLRVSNADKLHNTRSILADYHSIGEQLWDRFKGSREDQLWYYRELARLFADRRPGSPIARELAETVAQLERELGSPTSWHP